MPFCPECMYEYVDGVETCPDCRVRLIKRLHETVPQYQDDVELVCVASYPTAIDADMAKLKLDLAGVRCVLFDRMPVRSLAAPIMMDAGVRVMVDARDLVRAQGVLLSD